MWPPSIDRADLRIASDASDEGWGLYFEGRMEGGRWSETDARLHINVKEIMALLIFLRDFFSSIPRKIKVVVWETDNTSGLT